MIKRNKLILVAVLCCFIAGCYDSSYDPYESYEVRRAMDEAEMKKINNQTELDNAKHQIDMIAAENNVWIAQGPNDIVDIRGVNYEAVDELLAKLPDELLKDRPVLVASFVNLDDLKDTSTFGRVISEQVSSRFKQKGYTTIEMKLRTTVFIKAGSGEFLLSRELSEIGSRHRAEAVVVGSYAAAADKVYLTIRVVGVNDSRVVSSYDYSLPMTRDVFKMLLKDKADMGWL